MKETFIHNLKIIFPAIIAIIVGSLLWDKIQFEYHNPNEIVGYYSIFKHSALNDNFRYIFFVSLPLFTYLLSFIFFNKLDLKSLKEILILDKNNAFKENVSIIFLFYFLFILIIFFISQDFNTHVIDLFHEGQALSGALNFKLENELWKSSFVVTSLFVDILNANIAWDLFNSKSLSAYRYFIKILNLISALSIFIFIFKFVNGASLNKNLKTLFFIILGYFVFSLINNNAFSYRDLPLFIFFIVVYEIFNQKKINFLDCFILGVLPISSLLWSLDRGVFMIAGYIPLFLIFISNKSIKELILIILIFIISIFIFYLVIGQIEFTNFIINSLDILKGSDLLNGIIHPTPFTNQGGSTRATKNLIFIIINGIILINYFFKKKSNLNKNLILFIFLYYFVSLIFYKIGLTRSDGGHIKQGGTLNLILLIYFIIYNLLFTLNKVNKFENLKPIFFKLINSLLILVFFIIYIPNNSFKNIYNFKARSLNYIKTSDKFYLKPNEINLIKELEILTKYENCFQVFSYETAISYYLNKSSCTKFYHIMNMGQKKNQFLFVEELKKSYPKFILMGGTYQNIGNMKGRNQVELSPKDRFPYIYDFIMSNYKIFKEIDNWQILIRD